MLQDPSKCFEHRPRLETSENHEAQFTSDWPSNLDRFSQYESLSGTNINKKQKQQEWEQPAFEEIVQEDAQQGLFVLEKPACKKAICWRNIIQFLSKAVGAIQYLC